MDTRLHGSWKHLYGSDVSGEELYMLNQPLTNLLHFGFQLITLEEDDEYRLVDRFSLNE